jgi:hypothetical protein
MISLDLQNTNDGSVKGSAKKYAKVEMLLA